jgi:ATP-dependent Clp protease ATP-binding subunit ClpA
MIDRAVQPLKDLLPQCHSAAEAVAKLARRWSVLVRSDTDTAHLWLIVHSPALSVQIMASALAGALFHDSTAFTIVDCSVPENSQDELFGAPPGYKGCLEGGFITNQLKIRPELIVMLSNFEYADEGSLNVIHN